jgi:FAD:protein FMN transferase
MLDAVNRSEAIQAFPCFGSQCAVLVVGDGPLATAEQAVDAAKRRLQSWHHRFTRFELTSELSRLNADRRREVPVSPVMACFAEAVVLAGEATDGLVDGTLLAELRATGYREDLRTSVPLSVTLRLAPRRRPGRPQLEATWRLISVDRDRCTVRRPPGVTLDSGGLAKGLFADLLGQALSDHAGFAVDCAGDLRVGGADRRLRDGAVHRHVGRDLHDRIDGIRRRHGHRHHHDVAAGDHFQ